jgi:hypothetical protein
MAAIGMLRPRRAQENIEVPIADLRGIAQPLARGLAAWSPQTQRADQALIEVVVLAIGLTL